MSKPDFIYVTYIEAPQQRVWDALTQGEHTQHFWTRYVKSEWTPGARVEFFRNDRTTLSHDGEVLEIDPPNRLVMTFDVRAEGSDEPPSRVTYELSTHNGATKLTVIHDQFTGPDSKILKGISSGWPAILSSMKTYLERGSAMSMTEANRKQREG